MKKWVSNECSRRVGRDEGEEENGNIKDSEGFRDDRRRRGDKNEVRWKRGGETTYRR